MTEQGKSKQGVWLYFILVYVLVLSTHGLMAAFQIPGASAAAGAPSPSPLALDCFSSADSRLPSLASP